MKKRLSFLLAVGMICASAFPGVAGATTIDDLMQADTEGAEEEQFLCDSVSDQLLRRSCDL